jgi:hypothetical protein
MEKITQKDLEDTVVALDNIMSAREEGLRAQLAEATAKVQLLTVENDSRHALLVRARDVLLTRSPFYGGAPAALRTLDAILLSPWERDVKPESSTPPAPDRSEPPPWAREAWAAYDVWRRKQVSTDLTVRVADLWAIEDSLTASAEARALALMADVAALMEQGRTLAAEQLRLVAACDAAEARARQAEQALSDVADKYERALTRLDHQGRELAAETWRREQAEGAIEAARQAGIEEGRREGLRMAASWVHGLLVRGRKSPHFLTKEWEGPRENLLTFVKERLTMLTDAPEPPAAPLEPAAAKSQHRPLNPYHWASSDPVEQDRWATMRGHARKRLHGMEAEALEAALAEAELRAPAAAAPLVTGGLPRDADGRVDLGRYPAWDSLSPDEKRGLVGFDVGALAPISVMAEMRRRYKAAAPLGAGPDLVEARARAAVAEKAAEGWRAWARKRLGKGEDWLTTDDIMRTSLVRQEQMTREAAVEHTRKRLAAAPSAPQGGPDPAAVERAARAAHAHEQPPGAVGARTWDEWGEGVRQRYRVLARVVLAAAAPPPHGERPEPCPECGAAAARCSSASPIAALGGTVVKCERRAGHKGRHEGDRWYWGEPAAHQESKPAPTYGTATQHGYDEPGEGARASDPHGVAGNRCESGDECGRAGCPECQQ